MGIQRFCVMQICAKLQCTAATAALAALTAGVCGACGACGGSWVFLQAAGAICFATAAAEATHPVGPSQGTSCKSEKILIFDGRNLGNIGEL